MDTSATEVADSAPKTLTFYPFAYALLDDVLSQYCWYCLSTSSRDGDALKRCSGCRVAYFCSKKCLKLGWNDHKPECKGLVRTAPIVPDIEIRMLGRIVSRARLIEDGRDKDDPKFYHHRESKRTIMELWSHKDDMRKDEKAWKKFVRLHQGLIQFYPSGALFPNQDKVFELHCRNFINRHAISDRSYMREIGKGLYLDMCAYDHSCRPTSIYTCNGFVATLRPLTSDLDIRDRTTTFYTYIDLLATKSERRSILEQEWYFYCKCARCMDETEHVLTALLCGECGGPVMVNGSEARKPASCSHCRWEMTGVRAELGNSAMRDIDRLLSTGKLSEGRSDSAKLQLVRDLIDKYNGLLHPSNIYYVRLLQQAIIITDAVEPNNIGALMTYHMDAVDAMKVCYPANHPALAYHLMNTGIFCSQANQMVPARRFLIEALEMINFSLGPEHPMAQRAKEELKIVGGSEDAVGSDDGKPKELVAFTEDDII